MASTLKDKSNKRNKSKEIVGAPPLKKQQKRQDEDSACFFCNKDGHKKIECTKYHAWHVKKGTPLILICSKVNLTSISRHTWWIDSGATTHISVSMQGCMSCRTPNDVERYIYVSDGKIAKVEVIGNFSLLL